MALNNLIFTLCLLIVLMLAIVGPAICTPQSNGKYKTLLGNEIEIKLALCHLVSSSPK